MKVPPKTGEGRLAWMDQQQPEGRFRASSRPIDMRIGYSEIFTSEPSRRVGFLRDVVALLDGAGFDTLWIPEHVVQFDVYESEYPYGAPGRQGVTRTRPEKGNEGTLGYADGVVLLAAAAQMTNRMRMGTYVNLLTQRNPVVFARQVATLDHMSDGRFNFGVGVGWSQQESEAIGVPFERRGARLDEYLLAMKVLWTADPSEYHGEFVDFKPLRAYPKPLQQPHPPIFVGGQSKRGLRRAAEHGDGLILYNLELPDLELALDEFDRALEEKGRKMSDMQIVVGRRNEGRALEYWSADRDYIDACRALGVITEVVVSPRFPSGPEWFTFMEQYAEVIGVGAPRG